MNFPSFMMTGPAKEMPVAPLNYPMLNLMPAVQALRKEKATGSSSKKDSENKIDLDATRGQAEQWQRNYDNVKSKMGAIISYKGEEAMNDPMFKRLANEAAFYESPGVMQVLKRNRESQDKFISNIAEQNASGAIHLGMGFAGHGFYEMDHWRAKQENAETSGVGNVSLGAEPFLENFQSDFKVVGMKEVGEQLRGILATAGSSEKASATVSNNIENFVMGDMAGLLKTYNKNMTEVKSNFDAFGERGDKGPQTAVDENGQYKGTGQLGWAAYGTAWKRAGFEGLDLTDPINNGLLQSFAQKTLGIVRSGDPELANTKQAFWNRADGYLSKEEQEERDKRLNGYYFKKGVKDSNGRDLEGEIDMEAMLSDFGTFAMNTIDNEYNTHKSTTYRYIPDEQVTFYNQNEEQTRIGYAKKEADLFGTSALQHTEGLPVVSDQGYTGDQISSMFGISGKDNKLWFDEFYEMIGIKPATPDSQNKESLLGAATMSGTNSPFEALVSSDGSVRYIPKEDWNSDALYNQIKQNLATKYKDKWTEDEIKSETDKMMSGVRNAYNAATAKRYNESFYGLERQNTTVLDWDVMRVPEKIKETIMNSLFVKGPNGELIGRKASETLKNVDVKFGETIGEGRNFLGNIPLLSTSNSLTLAAFSIAGNSGFVAKAPISLGGTTYPAGQFVPMSKLDALDEKAAKQLLDSGNVIVGSGYWTKKNGKWVDNGLPDRTTNQPTGNISMNMLKYIYGPDSQNAQNVAMVPAQYYTEGTFGGDAAMVKQELKGKTFTKDVPAYATKPAGQKALNYAYEKASRTRPDLNPEKYANDLGLVGKSKDDFIREAKGKRMNEVIYLGGKYYGHQTFKEQTDWNTKAVLHSVPIIKENGQVDEVFARQTSWQENKGKIQFTGKVNVTGAIQASTDQTVRQSAVSGYNAWISNGTREKDNTGNTATVLPTIKAKK